MSEILDSIQNIPEAWQTPFTAVATIVIGLGTWYVTNPIINYFAERSARKFVGDYENHKLD